MFLILPIVLTIGYSFTNYGDGTRGTKEQAIGSIVASSVQQSPDSPRYAMTVATSGSPTEGPFELYLVNPDDGTVYRGDAETALEQVDPGAVTVVEGRVTEVQGLTVLDAAQVNAIYNELMELAVPVDESSAVRPLGVNQAFVGTTVLQYDAATDTITDTATGEEYTVGTVGDESTSWTSRASGPSPRAGCRAWASPTTSGCSPTRPWPTSSSPPSCGRWCSRPARCC